MGIPVAAFAEGFQSEQDGIVCGLTDGTEHCDLATAMPAAALVAGRDDFEAVGTIHGGSAG
jgi:hypothetical protein